MAKVKDNSLTRGLSGTIGRSLTFRQIGGETFVSKYQRAPTKPATEKALAARTKFGRATAYAKSIVKDPEIKAMYQTVAKGGQRAFNVAIMDALQAPNIESIRADNYKGRTGDLIFVRATDDFKVAGVTISFLNPSGELLELGNAVMQENNIDWVYTTTQMHSVIPGSKITAIASDLPGNSHSLSISL